MRGLFIGAAGVATHSTHTTEPAMHPLDIAFPQQIEFALPGGGVVSPKALTLGQLTRALTICAPLLEDAAQVEALAKSDATYAQLSEVVSKMFERAPGAMLDLMELLTTATRAQLEEMPADEGLVLAVLVLQLNASFFVSRVLPAIGGALAKMAEAKAARDGGMQSPSLSQQGTA